jgi:hypothetical protein
LILQQIQRIVSAGTPDLSGRMLTGAGSLPSRSERDGVPSPCLGVPNRQCHPQILFCSWFLWIRSGSGGNELPAVRFEQLKIYLPITFGVKAQNSGRAGQ